MTIEVHAGGDVHGPALSFQEGVLALVLPKAYAPGQPLELKLEAPSGAVELQGKSLCSKRRSDGQFDIRVRLINLRRTDRELLVSLLAS
jgi:hypothetical protein